MKAIMTMTKTIDKNTTMYIAGNLIDVIHNSENLSFTIKSCCGNVIKVKTNIEMSGNDENKARTLLNMINFNQTMEDLFATFRME